MKTKGINTTEKLAEFSRNKANSKRTDNEVYLKNMIISCFTYGSAEVNSHYYNQYISQYEEKLGTKLFKEVYEEQIAFLENNCKIERGVYTDGEGCTYNSLIVKES